MPSNASCNFGRRACPPLVYFQKIHSFYQKLACWSVKATSAMQEEMAVMIGGLAWIRGDETTTSFNAASTIQEPNCAQSRQNAQSSYRGLSKEEQAWGRPFSALPCSDSSSPCVRRQRGSVPQNVRSPLRIPIKRDTSVKDQGPIQANSNLDFKSAKTCENQTGLNQSTGIRVPLPQTRHCQFWKQACSFASSGWGGATHWTTTGSLVLRLCERIPQLEFLSSHKTHEKARV